MDIDNFDRGQILRKNLIKVQSAEERLDSKWYQSIQAIIGEETVISALGPFSHNMFHPFPTSIAQGLQNLPFYSKYKGLKSCSETETRNWKSENKTNLHTRAQSFVLRKQ